MLILKLVLIDKESANNFTLAKYLLFWTVDYLFHYAVRWIIQFSCSVYHIFRVKQHTVIKIARKILVFFLQMFPNILDREKNPCFFLQMFPNIFVKMGESFSHFDKKILIWKKMEKKNPCFSINFLDFWSVTVYPSNVMLLLVGHKSKIYG